MLVHAPAPAEKHGLLPKIHIKTNYMTAVPQPKAGNTISNLIHNSVLMRTACTEKQNSYSYFTTYQGSGQMIPVQHDITTLFWNISP